MQLLVEVAAGITHTLARVFPYLVAMGIGFALLSWLSPGNGGRPWWRKQGLVTDICYWIIVPVFTRYGRIGLTVLATAILFGITTGDGLIRFFEHGHGPIASLPLWLQIVIYMLTAEFYLYWVHRAFHWSGLWRYHAVHHASEEVEWISAARFHPVNLLLGTVVVDVVALIGGISPDIFLFMGPFDTVSSAFVHANLNWTLGPLKYVIAGPVFHRWHHTREHGNKNFAGTFSFVDLLFGTFHMPVGETPKNFGIDDASMPQSFGMQMLYPILQ
jgi:sterol desaturase/sphingolipid hydroxylase (fatty acid hydroxylase superfamily)